tara:strand:+ start:81175 stop:81993 length:819 start_codon:yes stop_codon:yes gene_type:complete
MKNFNNKIVVITGAGSGMGRAYAEEFGKLGARLALNDYSAEGLAETVELLRKQGVKDIYTEVFDVSSKGAMYAFAGNVKAELGDAHLIINNAGVEGAVKPTWTIDIEAYERMMGVNFWGVLYGTKAFLPQLMANNEGAIVNVSSIFGLIGTPNSSDYCAAKFAVRGFTEALMVELKESPIDAYLVHPGGIATNIAQKSEAQDFANRYLMTPPEAIAKFVIKSIRKRRLKIVYGHSALRVWMASNFVPLKLLISILWREMKSVTDLSDYPARR